MSRFVCIIAFLTLAGTASAQTMTAIDPVGASRAALFTPPLAGVTLPQEPLSAEVLPYVLIFSMLPPLRAVEAIGLGVGTVIALNHLQRDKRYGYDRQEHRYFLREDKPGRGGKSARGRVSSIYRHF